MVPEFDTAAFTIPPGELMIVKSGLGWHVLRVAEASFIEPEMEPAELKQRIDAGDATASPPTLRQSGTMLKCCRSGPPPARASELSCAASTRPSRRAVISQPSAGCAEWGRPGDDSDAVA